MQSVWVFIFSWVTENSWRLASDIPKLTAFTILDNMKAAFILIITLAENKKWENDRL